MYVTGTYGALLPVILSDIFGAEDIPITFSFQLASMAIPVFIGYPLFGMNQIQNIVIREMFYYNFYDKIISNTTHGYFSLFYQYTLFL